MTKIQAAIRALFKVDNDAAGNLPAIPGILSGAECEHIADGRALTARAVVTTSSDTKLRKDVPSSAEHFREKCGAASAPWRQRY